MKVSVQWLKEWAPASWSADEMGERLADLGFPVESQQRTGVQASGVISSKILSVEKHPNADRLRIAKVHDGQGERTVVCGAPNIAPGQVVPLALPGAKLQGGLQIAVSKIRGVESHGMLCSEKELGLSDDHSGILQLPAESKLGQEIGKVLGGEDVVYDLEIPPHRPDALSHVGIARELAALVKKPLSMKKIQYKPASSGQPCKVKISEPKLCSRYLGKLIHGVKIGPSPDWMARRLKACGIRPINNVVDITNYVLLEWGHPLHAFDFAKLEGGEIIVRKAKAREKILALDGRSYELAESDLVIADSRKPVAIAGVMGGQETGVTDQTVDILLESAVFERTSIRKTSRRLNLKSESSLRFERGTDAETAEKASLRAVQLILECAGGSIGRAADAFPVKPKQRSIELRRDRLTMLIGQAVEPAEVKSILTSLGFQLSAKAKSWTCKVPSHRSDVSEEVDLVEEVIRLKGYDFVVPQSTYGKVSNYPAELLSRNYEALSEFFQGLGFHETMTSSFCSADLLSNFGVTDENTIRLANPLSQDESILRSWVAPKLLEAVTRNIHVQQDDVFLFEIGKSYLWDKTETFPVEEPVLAFVMHGSVRPKTWQSPAQPVDFFSGKGLVDKIGKRFGLGFRYSYGSSLPFLHPQQSLHVSWEGQDCGWMGLAHPSVAQKFDLKGPCVIGEFKLKFPVKPASAVSEISKFPFVERDIAIVVGNEVSWDKIRSTVMANGGDILRSAAPFDVFSGEAIGQGKKSVAFRVRFQSFDHTLADSEISSAIEKIKSALQESCGAQLR